MVVEEEDEGGSALNAARTNALDRRSATADPCLVRIMP